MGILIWCMYLLLLEKLLNTFLPTYPTPINASSVKYWWSYRVCNTYSVTKNVLWLAKHWCWVLQSTGGKIAYQIIDWHGWSNAMATKVLQPGVVAMALSTYQVEGVVVAYDGDGNGDRMSQKHHRRWCLPWVWWTVQWTVCCCLC